MQYARFLNEVLELNQGANFEEQELAESTHQLSRNPGLFIPGAHDPEQVP